jgi:hypothetical protein
MPDPAADTEFDFAQFIQSPMAMLATVMGAADTAKKTFTAFSESVQSLQRSAAAMESILGRIDTVVSQIEAPAQILGPEMERLARRMASMTDVFDRVPVEQIPELFELLSAQMSSVLSGLGGLAELPKRLGPLGELFGGASGLFGSGKPATGKPATGKPAASEQATETVVSRSKVPAKQAATKRVPSARTSVPKSSATKSSATKSSVRRASGKRV